MRLFVHKTSISSLRMQPLLFHCSSSGHVCVASSPAAQLSSPPNTPATPFVSLPARTRPCLGAQGMKSLFSTLVVSLPAFGNVGALIGLFLFMYAYVGVLLFGKVQRSARYIFYL
jgi:hypothetical protein